MGHSKYLFLNIYYFIKSDCAFLTYTILPKCIVRSCYQPIQFYSHMKKVVMRILIVDRPPNISTNDLCECWQGTDQVSNINQLLLQFSREQ